MNYHLIDIVIILLYLLISIAVGWWVSNRASRDIQAYFLGGNTLPWYFLGVSNASGMFDIAGTMWLVMLAFIYGMKSVWLPWAWPVFNQIFLMMYLSVWLRRSNVMTGAEWIKTRFGEGKGAKLAHIVVVVFALVSVIGFLAYGFKGIGKFADNFLPWKLNADPNTNSNLYALCLMGITTFYVVKGGMFSVVITEVIQFLILSVASVVIGIIAMGKVSAEKVAANVPSGWGDIFFGSRLVDLNWNGIIDSVHVQIQNGGYFYFSAFFMMMTFKGVLVSMAGPAPNYDMQRILATRSPKDAAKMSGFVNVVLYFPRYLMIMGLTVLSIVYFRTEIVAMGDKIDFEKILPYALARFVPVGILGLLIAGLLSAFMSNFAATVNAAPAYIVNDIYKRFINPNDSPRKYVRISYIASFAVVAIGISFGFVVQSIDSVVQWITAALWGGYVAANVLKWYWWRFNGYGYFWGMVAGIGGALVIPLLPFAQSKVVEGALFMPHALSSFPYILAVSLVGCVLGSLLTEPEDDDLLMRFYTRVRPWGFWGPIRARVLAENPNFPRRTEFRKDCINVLIGVVWQTAIVALPMYIVLQAKWNIMVAVGVILITTLILKKTWWDKLQD